jgi:hypothetical protein
MAWKESERKPGPGPGPYLLTTGFFLEALADWVLHTDDSDSESEDKN